MRILLAHNSLYYPSYGGGDKSNRLLMEALASRGHEVRVVARVEHFGPEAHVKLLRELGRRNIAYLEEVAGILLELNGVRIHILTRDPFLRPYFTAQVDAFDPDVILTSTDDPAHLMLESAMAARRARVVYLVRATIALPFGPDSSFPSEAKAATLRRANGVVAVSEYVAAYTRRWGEMEAMHLPISLLDPGEYPALGHIDNRFVTMVNPCAVKGISIFLKLAERMPHIEFAAVPTWGTTAADLEALRRLPNITILPPVDDIHQVMRHTRVALVPSLWAEARSRIILEAMVRGIPVLASDVGGLAEAKLGVDYLLPVNPVVRYHPRVDELMVPMAEVPQQNVEPWLAVLSRLLTDREHYRRLSGESRRAALAYAADLNVLPFEQYLQTLADSGAERLDAPVRSPKRLSSDKQKLLALRLKRKAKDVD